jgi:hypothetical protein
MVRKRKGKTNNSLLYLLLIALFGGLFFFMRKSNADAQKKVDALLNASKGDNGAWDEILNDIAAGKINT